jgi:hypothetical protein
VLLRERVVAHDRDERVQQPNRFEVARERPMRVTRDALRQDDQIWSEDPNGIALRGVQMRLRAVRQVPPFALVRMLLGE